MREKNMTKTTALKSQKKVGGLYNPLPFNTTGPMFVTQIKRILVNNTVMISRQKSKFQRMDFVFVFHSEIFIAVMIIIPLLYRIFSNFNLIFDIAAIGYTFNTK